MGSLATRIFVLVTTIFALTGCPRFAYVELYNNTSETLFVSAYTDELEVKSGFHGRFELTGSNFSVSSKLGNWEYNRAIPHDGEYGPYFNGTLKAQINQNGKIYALKQDQKAPKPTFDSQPDGYPIEPNT
jgi:hypothetical protein